MVTKSLGIQLILLLKGNAPPALVGYLSKMYLSLLVTSCRTQLLSNQEGAEKGQRSRQQKQHNTYTVSSYFHLFAGSFNTLTCNSTEGFFKEPRKNEFCKKRGESRGKLIYAQMLSEEIGRQIFTVNIHQFFKGCATSTCWITYIFVGITLNQAQGRHLASYNRKMYY